MINKTTVKMTTVKMTYVEFGKIVKTLSATIEDKALAKAVYDKAQDLIDVNMKKAERQAERQASKPRESKVSAATLSKAERIKSVLEQATEALTGDEIEDIVQLSMTPLDVANAIKFVDNVVKSKKKMVRVDKKGETVERMLTAYQILTDSED